MGSVSVTATVVGQSSTFTVTVPSLPGNSLGSGTGSAIISSTNGGSAGPITLGSTGITVSVRDTGAPAGTLFSAVGQLFSSPTLGVSIPGLTSVAYFDLSVGGVTTGTVTVCVPDTGVASGFTMQYYQLPGGPWITAD